MTDTKVNIGVTSNARDTERDFGSLRQEVNRLRDSLAAAQKLASDLVNTGMVGAQSFWGPKGWTKDQPPPGYDYNARADRFQNQENGQFGGRPDTTSGRWNQVKRAGNQLASASSKYGTMSVMGLVGAQALGGQEYIKQGAAFEQTGRGASLAAKQIETLQDSLDKLATRYTLSYRAATQFNEAVGRSGALARDPAAMQTAFAAAAGGQLSGSWTMDTAKNLFSQGSMLNGSVINSNRALAGVIGATQAGGAGMAGRGDELAQAITQLTATLTQSQGYGPGAYSRNLDALFGVGTVMNQSQNPGLLGQQGMQLLGQLQQGTTSGLAFSYALAAQSKRGQNSYTDLVRLQQGGGGVQAMQDAIKGANGDPDSLALMAKQMGIPVDQIQALAKSGFATANLSNGAADQLNAALKPIGGIQNLDPSRMASFMTAWKSGDHAGALKLAQEQGPEKGKNQNYQGNLQGVANDIVASGKNVRGALDSIADTMRKENDALTKITGALNNDVVNKLVGGGAGAFSLGGIAKGALEFAGLKSLLGLGGKAISSGGAAIPAFTGEAGAAATTGATGGAADLAATGGLSVAGGLAAAEGVTLGSAADVAGGVAGAWGLLSIVNAERSKSGKMTNGPPGLTQAWNASDKATWGDVGDAIKDPKDWVGGWKIGGWSPFGGGHSKQSPTVPGGHSGSATTGIAPNKGLAWHGRDTDTNSQSLTTATATTAGAQGRLAFGLSSMQTQTMSTQNLTIAGITDLSKSFHAPLVTSLDKTAESSLAKKIADEIVKAEKAANLQGKNTGGGGGSAPKGTKLSYNTSTPTGGGGAGPGGGHLLPPSWYAAIQAHESSLPLPGSAEANGQPEPMFGFIPGAPYSSGSHEYKSGGSAAASAENGWASGTTWQSVFPSVDAGMSAADDLIRKIPGALEAAQSGDFPKFMRIIAPTWAGTGEKTDFAEQTIANFDPSVSNFGGYTGTPAATTSSGSGTATAPGSAGSGVTPPNAGVPAGSTAQIPYCLDVNGNPREADNNAIITDFANNAGIYQYIGDCTGPQVSDPKTSATNARAGRYSSGSNGGRMPSATMTSTAATTNVHVTGEVTLKYPDGSTQSAPLTSNDSSGGYTDATTQAFAPVF